MFYGTEAFLMATQIISTYKYSGISSSIWFIVHSLQGSNKSGLLVILKWRFKANSHSNVKAWIFIYKTRLCQGEQKTYPNCTFKKKHFNSVLLEHGYYFSFLFRMWILILFKISKQTLQPTYPHEKHRRD